MERTLAHGRVGRLGGRVVISRFRYRAVAADGRIVSGALVGDSVPVIEAQLGQSGLVPLRIRPELAVSSWFVRGSDKELLESLASELAVLLRARVPLTDALRLLSGLEDEACASLTHALLQRLHAGRTLSQAAADFPQVFGDQVPALLALGETSGTLSTVLADIAAMVRWQRELAERTRAVLTYPALVLVAMLGALGFLLLGVVPELGAYLQQSGVALSWQTEAMLALSAISLAHLLMVGGSLLSLMIAALLATKWSPDYRLYCHGVLLRMWCLGPLLLQYRLAAIAHYLAVLLQARVELLEALRAAAAVTGSPVLTVALLQVRQRIIEGDGLAQAMQQSRWFPAAFSRRVAIGENSGELVAALQHLGEWYRARATKQLNRMERLIGPLLLVLLGGLLVWVVLAVFDPMYGAQGTGVLL